MNTKVQTPSEHATATLTIPGMGSDHCAGIVKTSLSRLEGVGEIRTSIASHRAEVAFDPSQVDAAALRKAVERAGYEVDAVSEVARSGATEVRLIVPGMGSDHCAGIVSESIRRLPGIADVSTSIASHRVRVRLMVAARPSLRKEGGDFRA